ncbi:MAG: choice-of-anchor Q domain-containing protein [Defluviimonas denitrificans]
MFDGMFDGFVIRNNVIASTHYHGITINGALNSKIVNNTVVNITGQKTNYPWVMLSPHKNGTPSKNVDVANNLAMDIRVKPNPSLGHTVLNNVIPGSIFNDFTAPGNQDYTLKSGSSAIDKGAAAYAPQDDLVGAARPKGKAPDAGAYESF